MAQSSKLEAQRHKARKHKSLSMTASLLFILVILAFIFFSPVAIIAGIITRSENPVHWIGRLWARIALRASRIKVIVRGREHIPREEPAVFACNHASQSDILVLYQALPIQFRFLVKKELFKIPLLGIAMRWAGYIPVDRLARGKAALRSLQKAVEKIKKGTSIVIFPEGTRSPDGRLRPFKIGGMLVAAKAECPIVPVAISGSHRVFPKGDLKIYPGQIKVVIGPSIQTKGPEGTLPRDMLAKKVWEAIFSMLDEENRPI